MSETRSVNKLSRSARNQVVTKILGMSPEDRGAAYLRALYDGDSRRARVIARALIPKDWVKAIRYLWFDRRGLSDIAVRVDEGTTPKSQAGGGNPATTAKENPTRGAQRANA